jgi:hypothetical protein
MSARFEKIWRQQCGATKRIKRRFGAKSALDYMIREKLLNFAQSAERRPEFARELSRFLAAVVWRIFNEFEIAGYVASLKPKAAENTAQPAVAVVTSLQVRQLLSWNPQTD